MDRALSMQCSPQVLERTTRQLVGYCRANDWAGYDPYDALNSRILQSLKIYKFKFARLFLTQALKRSPVNFRPLLFIPKTHNPKGIALFVSALTKLRSSGTLEIEAEEISRLANLLLDLRSTRTTQSTWGYSFNWQTRTELIPKGSSNIICTTFAANALLDAFTLTGEDRYADAALSAANFILETLYSDQDGIAWFNYTPLETTQIHNANLLGAALLCRVADVLGESKFLEPALRAARYSVDRQNPDGSWFYGERKQPSQKWIDNFHTGFNLCALNSIKKHGDTAEFETSLRRGLDYYIVNFFEEDGAPKYFHNKTFPVDIHSAAQSIVTLNALSRYDIRCVRISDAVLKWTLANLWNGESYFYYQKFRVGRNKIPYIRWSQAWMLFALSHALNRMECDLPDSSEEKRATGFSG